MVDFIPVRSNIRLLQKTVFVLLLLIGSIQYIFAQSPITASAFVSQTPITTGVSPYSIVSSDLDGDGKPDLVVSVGGFPYAVSIFPNKGTAGNFSFAPNIDLVTGVVPFGLAVGDVNGDGKPDIIVTNSGVGSYTISIFVNTSTPGNISFATGIQYPTGADPISVAMGDLNGDGRPDIVTANYASSTISVFENISSGSVVSFTAEADIATGSFPNTVKIADLDGDGKPDVGVVNNSSNSVSLFRNTSSAGGTISFDVKIDLATNNSPQSMVMGDIDGDGKPDLAITNGPAGNISVFRNISTAGLLSFSPKSDFATAGGPLSLALGDLNKDGKPDLAITSGDSISIIINSTTAGNISFYPAIVLAAGNTAHDITIADLDGDGKPDLATANEGSNNISLFLNKTDVPIITGFTPQGGGKGTTINIRGSNFSTASQVWFGGTAAASFTVVSDTLIKAVVDTGSSGSISILNLRGTGSISGFQYFNSATISSFNPQTGGPGTTVTISGKYFTGATTILFGGTKAISFTVVSDSLIRAIVGNGSSGSLTVVTPADSVTMAGFIFSNAIPVISSFTPGSGIIGSTVKINGRNFNSLPANNIVYFGTVRAVVTAATTTSLTITVPVGATYQPISVTTNNLTAYSVEPFHTSFGLGGTFTPASFNPGTDFTAINPPINIRSADLDGDGKQDLIEINQQGNTLLVFRNTTSGAVISFGPRMDLKTGIGPNLVAVGDLDGDGLLDLVVVNITDNTVSVFKNTSTPGNISFLPKVDYATAEVPRSVAIGDIDGDGRPDLVVANSYSYTSTVSVLRNTSSPGTISFDTHTDFQTGNGPVTVALADLDGDGKTDVVTGNFNANTVSVLRNKSSVGSISLDSKLDFATGTNPLIITIGDMDGDGRPDIVSINTEVKSLSILGNKSSSGNISFAAKQDFPVDNYARDIAMGDLDGDGKPDLLIADYEVDSVSIYRNTSNSGNITLAPKVNFRTTNQAQSVWIADFDGDGKNDIASGNYTVISILTSSGLVSASPVINSFSPTSAGSGATIQIKGENFTGLQSVSFGGVEAKSFIVVSDSVVSAVVGSGTSGSLVVLTPGGTDSLSGFLFTGPIITNFTPQSAGPGTLVQISGTHFTGTTAVQFGGVPAASFTVTNDSLIKAMPGTGASGDISVTTSAGTATKPGFIYVDTLLAPVIHSFTPLSGPSGTICTIKGLHFSKVTVVHFGGVTASSFTIFSDTLITATVGSGATGSVYVSNATGADSLAGFTFTVLPPPPPVIYSFSPSTGWTGTVITIKGLHFTGTTYVGIGGYIATSYSVVSDSVITAVLNAGSTGAVVVTTPNGTASLDGFIFEHPDSGPSIQSFNPVTGGTGTTVTIHGIRFTGVTSVSFGGISAASYTFIDDSTIQAIVGNGSSGNVMVSTTAGSVSMDGFTYISPLDSSFAFNFFTANISVRKTQLNWETIHEQSIVQYVIEHGTDGISFQKLDSQYASHPQSGSPDYAYVDMNPVSGNNYYRIGALDTSGNYIFSHVVGLNGSDTTNSVRLFPNPTQSYVYVQYSVSAKPGEVRIIDITGNLVAKYATEPNSSIIKIYFTGIKPGVYIVFWSDGSKPAASTLDVR